MLLASHLRQSGIEEEIVDMLQGLVPRTVFAHYILHYSLNTETMLYALNNLKKPIEQ